ncbi:MAG: pectate lyase [Opitutus sp.]|nr:pectate lyase [Opitutus sp.]
MHAATAGLARLAGLAIGGLAASALWAGEPKLGQGPAAGIETAGFNDAAHHWRGIKEPERVMQMEPDQPSYSATQVREIAANILLFQRANGGWPKDYDMLAILTAAQKKALRDSHDRSDTTFDNHTTHTQVDYLARAFSQLGDAAYRAAAERGFDFMLAAQYPSGGFPQKWPAPKGIGARITFNDGVMIGILTVLRAAAEGAPHFSWLDPNRRERARVAVEMGTASLLRCQMRVDGRLTAWGQQHDEKTFATTAARTFELACHSPADTTEIVEFLMGVAKPSAEIVTAVDAAVAWLRRVRLEGIRVERIAAPPAEFIRHNTSYDVVVVPDPAAPVLWARMYEVGSDRPIFASRDGIKVYSLAEVDRERRTGSGWYGGYARRLLSHDYPAWRAMQR